MASLIVSDIGCISSTLPASFQHLVKSIESNVQCHRASILEQLLQIQKFILFCDYEENGKRSDALLDAGIIKIIVKLLHSTKNSTIIDNCFDLTKYLTDYAKQAHYVTNDYVRMCLYWLKITCLCSFFKLQYDSYTTFHILININYNYNIYIFTD